MSVGSLPGVSEPSIIPTSQSTSSASCIVVRIRWQYSGARRTRIDRSGFTRRETQRLFRKIVAVSGVVEGVSEVKKMFTLVEASEPAVQMVVSGRSLWPRLVNS